MTVFMVIVCALNIAAFVVALVLFAFVYRIVKNGKSYDRIDAELDTLRSSASSNISSILTKTVVGGASGFIVGTANSVYTRFGGTDPNRFTERDLVFCHQTARREAELAAKSSPHT